MCDGETYFDNAATSRFKPKSVIKAVKKELEHSANAGRSGHKASVAAGLTAEICRERIKEITFDGNVIFTKNCTEALNLAIFGLKLKSGDSVITSVFEHNSVLRPLERLKDSGVEIVYLYSPDGKISEERLSRAINRSTKLVVMSEMSNVTGRVQNLAALGSVARKNGVLFLADAAQSLGHIKSDYSFVDMIASSGHKGLHGPQGTGFLAFRKGITLSPLLCGGTGTDSASAKQPIGIPEGLESGTLNLAGIAGLSEGIAWTTQNIDRITLAERRMAKELLDGLKAIPGVTLYTDNENGVLSFNIGNMTSSEAADILDAEYKIAVRSGLHCAPLLHKYNGTLNRGAVRASVGMCNTPSDVKKLLLAVSELAKRQK